MKTTSTELPWQDIATAPKDGTRVLVVAAIGESDRRGRRDRAMIAAWREQFVNRFAWVDDCGHARQPTHWAPLPALPATGGQS